MAEKPCFLMVPCSSFSTKVERVLNWPVSGHSRSPAMAASWSFISEPLRWVLINSAARLPPAVPNICNNCSRTSPSVVLRKEEMIRAAKDDLSGAFLMTAFRVLTAARRTSPCWASETISRSCSRSSGVAIFSVASRAATPSLASVVELAKSIRWGRAEG